MKAFKVFAVTALFAASFAMLVEATVKSGFTGQICITKFEDKNSNGVRDAGEPGLPGWTFIITPGNIRVTTGAGGKVCFTRPTPGVYKITEQPQLGWTSIGPASKIVTLHPGQTVTVSFANGRVM